MDELECEVMGLDELEAVRLADLEGMYQEDAARKMGISRSTLARLVESGRHDQLVAQGGLYHELWTRQQGMITAAPEAGGGQLITPDRLALIPFLSECSRQTLEELSELFVLSHFAEGQYVFHHGDPGDHFYLIARGCVQVMVPDGDGQRVVNTLHDGDFFGEIALLRNVPRSASIVAWADTWCLSLSCQHFLRIIGSEPGLHARVIAAVQAVVGDETPS